MVRTPALLYYRRMRIAAVLIIGYLLGSIPFGYLIVRAKAGADVRETGSGGTGATNVTRRAGRWAGVLTLLLDAVKGAAAVWIATEMLGDTEPKQLWIAAAGVAAVLGHCFPLWLGFRGGKGVATAIGVYLVLGWFPLLFSIVLLILVIFFTRYVSLGSIIAFVSLPFFIWLTVPRRYPVNILVISAAAIAAIVVFKHRENISRLLAGTENKFK